MQLHPKTRVPLILTSGSSHHHHQTNSISCDSSSLSSASSMSYPTLETPTQRGARGRLTSRRQAQRMITSRASRSNRCCSYINNNNNFSSLLKSESITSHNSPKKSQHQSTMTQMPNTKQTKLRPIPRAKLAMSSLTLVVLLALSSTIMFLSSSSVFQAQAIKLQPEGKEKFYWSGEQFVITCQNNNNIKNVKIRWIGPNGHDITDDKSQRVHAESTGPHGSRLVVMNATTPNDDGQYKCTLGSTDDRNPREHIEFELKLYKTTSFKDTARKSILSTGSSGTLNCKVEFDPGVLTPTVEWVRDNIPIDMHNDSSFRQIEYDPNHQLSQLIISPVSKSHDGIYTCRAVAVTTQLSKISDHNIQLEVNYAPSFDRDSETVWVERAQSAMGAGNRQANHHSNNNNNNNVYGAVSRAGGARNRFKQQHHAGGTRGRPVTDADSTEQGDNSLNGTVRVELRCTCQANPPASILWTSSHSENFVLAKGSMPHILEEPRVESDGPNTTSVLVINYSLDPNWEHRRDTYTCSASNKLGKAAKKFTVEQGDPPPAFNIAPVKSYNPETTQFRFTLLGPNYDPDLANSLSASQQTMAGSGGSLAQDIRPPVDSFRIRAESPSGGSSSASENNNNRQQVSYLSNSRRHNEPSVQWNLMTNGHQDQQQVSRLHLQQTNLELSQFAPLQLGAPRNFTINLGRLPAGNQKLFLEAHNAVGWSPNATYLGEYYIVSGANSIMGINLANILMLVIISLTISLTTMQNQQPTIRRH